MLAQRLYFKNVGKEEAMPMVSMRQLLDHVAEHDYGVPAFKVNNMEQMHSIVEAVENTDSPVFVQASAGIG